MPAARRRPHRTQRPAPRAADPGHQLLPRPGRLRGARADRHRDHRQGARRESAHPRLGPGTSTGEEAYSIAILFAEAFERARRWPPLKLFATDVEQHNVDFGSAGVFSEAITTEVSPERLEQWFYKRGNHFVIKNEIRQNIVFARHNLLQDPPFTRMDLVSCRNLLIYFRSRGAGSRAAPTAIRPGARRLPVPRLQRDAGQLQSDFTAVNSKHKVFRILRHLALPLDTGAAQLTRWPAARATPDVDSARSPPDRRRRHRRRPDRAAALLRAHQPAAERQPGAAARVRRRQPLSAHRRGRGHPGPAKLLPPTLAPVAQALLHKTSRGQDPLRSDLLSMQLPDGERERLRLVARSVELESGRGAPAVVVRARARTRSRPARTRLGPARHRDHGHGAGDRRSASRPWSASSPPPARACRPPSRSWKPPTRNCRPPTRS
jgi:hypothetical protein